MIEVEKSQIDIGRNPSAALEKVSNPILFKLRDTLEKEHADELLDNMLDK